MSSSRIAPLRLLMPMSIVNGQCYGRLNEGAWRAFNSSRLSVITPFGSQIFVRQSLDVDPSDHRPRLETLLLSGFGVVPVGQRNPSGTFIDPAADRIEKGIPVLRLVCQSGLPDLPVQLGVVPAVIEGQAEVVDVLEVEGDLGLPDLGRE